MALVNIVFLALSDWKIINAGIDTIVRYSSGYLVCLLNWKVIFVQDVPS